MIWFFEIHYRNEEQLYSYARSLSLIIQKTFILIILEYSYIGLYTACNIMLINWYKHLEEDNQIQIWSLWCLSDIKEVCSI